MAHAVALLPEYGEPAAVAAAGRAEQLRVKTVRQLRQAGPARVLPCKFYLRGVRLQDCAAN